MSFAGDFLDQEGSSKLQHSGDFTDGAAVIVNVMQHAKSNDGVELFVLEWQRRRIGPTKGNGAACPVLLDVSLCTRKGGFVVIRGNQLLRLEPAQDVQCSNSCAASQFQNAP